MACYEFWLYESRSVIFSMRSLCRYFSLLGFFISSFGDYRLCWVMDTKASAPVWTVWVCVFSILSRFACCLFPWTCEFVLAQEEEDMWMVRDDVIDVRVWTCAKEDAEGAVFHPSGHSGTFVGVVSWWSFDNLVLFDNMRYILPLVDLYVHIFFLFIYLLKFTICPIWTFGGIF